MRSEVYSIDDQVITINWPGDVKLEGSDSDRLADWLALVRDKIMNALILSVSPRALEPDPWTPGEAEELSKVDFIDPGPPEPPEAKPLFTGKVYLGDLQAACEAYNEARPEEAYQAKIVLKRKDLAEVEPADEPEPPLLRPETKPLTEPQQPRKCSGYKQSEQGVVIARCVHHEGHDGPHMSPRGQTWDVSPPQVDYSAGAELMAERKQREADLSSRIPHDYLADPAPAPGTAQEAATHERWLGRHRGPERHCDPGCIHPIRPHTGRCVNAHGYPIVREVLSQMRQAEPELFESTPEPVKLVESEIPIMYGVNMREALSLGAGMVPELAEAMIPPVHHAEVLSVIDEARNELAELEAFGKSLEARVTSLQKAAIADQEAERAATFKWNDPAYKAEPKLIGDDEPF